MALTSAQERAMSLLLGEETRTYEQIADDIHVAASTINKWVNGLNGPGSREFQAEYQRRLAAISGPCKQRLRRHAHQAITVLLDVMAGQYGPRSVGVAKTRLDAAESLMDRIGLPKASKLQIGDMSDEELEAEVERRIRERGLLAAEEPGAAAAAEGAAGGSNDLDPAAG